MSDVDSDPEETQDWLESLTAVIEHAGEGRGRYLLKQLELHAQNLNVFATAAPYSAYRNTIPLEQQSSHPGDIALEERITAMVRWNALAMVVRANQAYGDLGGHIASYASAAEIFEIGFNHFFRGPAAEGGADLVFFQPHSAPGVYGRAFLEDRLSEEQLGNYRQEVGGKGLCSYPHPWLMPDFWQFPTGSMGIGPINAIYQARFMRYLQNRGLVPVTGRHVWGVFGDGEMDEPESIAALTLAARERLDNLTFVINCNLQRLDGPVRGNGQIIQELEGVFAGAGWNVIKVLWGSDWDPLFARDHDHALLKQLAATVDGQYQTLGANDGAYNQEHFFQLSPALKKLVAHMSAPEIDGLKRGGHDFRKLYAAFERAKNHPDQPTVILAKTKKGYGMGNAGESRNTSHQQKKLDEAALRDFRDRFDLPLSDEDIAGLRFLKPSADSPEISYLKARREALGGPVPSRIPGGHEKLEIPPIESYADFAINAGDKEMSTTMAFMRFIMQLLRNKALAPRIVPIVADEARTFGMANLFRQIGIYAPLGQLYSPEDADTMMSYREAKDGQILEEGITEAGAMSSWIAAATAYSVHEKTLIPFYIYYSMFGFQRVGDLIWAAADQRARGFLVGATAGRTTLGGEGLQHQDGSSLLVASTIPNCRAYDAAFAGELAVIFDHGAREMFVEGKDVFYYLTTMNENYAQPTLSPEHAEGVIKGMYRFSDTASSQPPAVRLLGSGAILREVIAAAQLLKNDWQIESEVWSVTSFTELEREARSTRREARLASGKRRDSYVGTCLAGDAPVIAASDYVAAYGGMIAQHVRAPYLSLGTDGFGRSDTRSALRNFFEVNRHHVVLAALMLLAESGRVPYSILENVKARYEIDSAITPPWER